MAKVSVISFINGGIPQEAEADTPAQIAANMGMGLENTKIYVDESSVTANHFLRDGDLVSFQKSKVESGS